MLNQKAPKKTCIVVDDDEVDILTLVAFLEEYDFIKVVGRYRSPVEALTASQISAPDVLFLDIDMPEMTGLELRKHLQQIPACIFITSYPDYAVESFEMEALDFLVKPFGHERFARTMVRLESYLTLLQKAELLNHTLGADTIYIKDGLNQIKLQLHEIIYLEALNNYTSIVTNKRKYTVLAPISGLLKEKSFKNFIRIHRSYAVQKNFVEKIGSGEVHIGITTLPVGRIYKDSLDLLKS